MSDERTDLTPLALDHQREAALTAAILARSEPILTRYAARGAMAVVAGWIRPALAAAAVVSGIAVGSLLITNGESTAASTPSTSEALGFPGPVVAWAEAGQAPSLEEIVISLEEASR